MHRNQLIPLVLGGIAGLALASTASAQLFIPVDLGVPAGFSASDAFDVNIHREVVGTVSNGSDPQAYIWLPQAKYGLPAGMTVLGTLTMTSGEFSFANAINDCGQVVGTSSVVGQGLRSFIWQNGVLSDAGALSGAIGSSIGHDISNRGLMVGSSDVFPTPPTEIHAFATVFPCNAPLPPAPAQWDLGTLGGNFSTAFAINERGNIVGQSRPTPGFETHAFFASGVTAPLVDLGKLPGSDRSSAEAISDQGTVVGFSLFQSTGISRLTAWRLVAGQWVIADLGSFNNHTETVPHGINLQGDIIGRGYTASTGVTEAFLWTAGVYHNLNDILIGGGSIVIEEALGLNENGDIAAFGRDGNGNYRAFLLIRQ